MSNTALSSAALNSSDSQRIKNIQSAIRQKDADLKNQFSIFQHQDALGLFFCLLALVGMIATGAAYIADIIPAWLAIIVSCFFASISHEIEHDLIHRLYFRKNKFMHNLMMLLVWIMRPNTVNPWYRRGIHFNHHKVSGTADDIEERVLGNGMQFGLKRLLISLDGFLSIFLRFFELKNMKDYSFFKFVIKGSPMALTFVVGLYGFFLFHAYDFVAAQYGFFSAYPQWFVSIIEVLNIVAVVWLLPNFLRALCLHNITAVMHYYGDVDSLLKQCQVMNHWALLPIHALCMNFGATHTLHHFVVSQPFYLRQLTAKSVYPVMKKNGVRFNDFASLVRSNRFTKTQSKVNTNLEAKAI